MRDSEHIEEERRVLYVALTRAQNELIINRRDGNNRAASFSVSPENQKAAVAYFLNELPADLVS
jgi:DNA helicase-2/ATP-dependent DNA helicase PcrA